MKLPPLLIFISALVALGSSTPSSSSSSSSSLQEHPRRHHRHRKRRHQTQVREEYLIVPDRGDAFLGCDETAADIAWLKDGQIVEGVEYFVREKGGENPLENNEDEEADALYHGARLVSEYLPTSRHHRLKIGRLQPQDSGEWRCRKSGSGNNSAAAPSQVWILLVLPSLEKPFVFYKRGEFLRESTEIQLVRMEEGGNSIVVREGDDLRLFCVALRRKSSSHSAAVEWSAQRPELIRPTRKEENLFVQNRADLAAFLSVVESAHQIDRTSAGTLFNCADLETELRVKFPPTFTIRRTPGFGAPIIEGMTVELECAADIGDTSSARWVKDNLPIASKGGKVFIDRVDPEIDPGWYQCFLDFLGDEYSSVAYFLTVKPSPVTAKPISNHSNNDDQKTPYKNSALSSASGSSEAQSGSIEVRLEENRDSSKINGNKNEVIADNVVFTSENEKGNCSEIMLSSAAAGFDYRRPHLTSRNQSVIRISGDENRNTRLNFDVCCNPGPSLLIWTTPSGAALRPGESRSGFVFFNTSRLESNVTCLSCVLEIKESSSENIWGEYVLFAKNEFGLTDGVSLVRSRNGQKSELTSEAGEMRSVSKMWPLLLTFLYFARYL